MLGSVNHGDNGAMKFASYADGSRDGQLVLVSRDLTQALYATHIATRLQAVLEDWNFLAPQLQDLYDSLNAGRARHAFAFDPARCLAPLPRSYQHVQAFAYGEHLARLRAGDASQANASGLELAWRSGDSHWGAQAVAVTPSEALDADFEVQWGMVTGDIPAGASVERALDGVRLLVLAQAMVLRAVAQGWGDAECAGVGARMGVAFAPVALTLDELGECWHRGRLQSTLVTIWNGRKVGMSDTGQDMGWHAGSILAQLASTRALGAGTLVTLGPVCNRGSEKKGATEWPKGYHSIADKRAMEQRQDGQASTGYLRWGDVVRSEAKGPQGQSLFGAVECELASPQDRAADATHPPASADAA